jgi:hypothetical protein
MSAAVWHWGPGDTDPLTGTLEREISKDVFVPEDLSGVLSVTLTLYRPNGAIYRADAPVDFSADGSVSFTPAAGDTKQGPLEGRFRVTYANNVKVSFPRSGRFPIMVK